MVAAAAASGPAPSSSSSSASAPQTPKQDASGKKMDDAIGKAQGQSGQPAQPQLQPANDTGSSASGQPAANSGKPAGDPSASGQPAPANGQSGSDPSASGGQTGKDIVGSLKDGMGDAANVLKDPTGAVKKLNSDGDQVVVNLTATADGQVQIPDTPIAAGGKAQYGYNITVKQVGDAPAPGTQGQKPSYDVTFDKNLLGGVMAEPTVPVIDPGGELNLTSADSVTMNFKTPEDAGRAVTALQKLAGAETVRDLGKAATPGLSNPASNPLPADDSSLSGTAPTEPLAKKIGPSDADMSFLRDNIKSYTQTVGVQERGRVAAKFANFGVDTRLDGNQKISRTVEPAKDGQPGKLTYTLSGDLTPSSREKFTVGLQNLDQTDIGYRPMNIVDHGQAKGEVSLSWDLPVGREDPSISGRPVPEAGSLSGNGLGAPSEAKVKLTLDTQDQSLKDLSRTDLNRNTLEATVKNPGDHLGPVFGKLLDGDLRGAAGSMGKDFTVTAQSEHIQRDGVKQQHEVGIEVADTTQGSIGFFGEVGTDDVSNRTTKTLTGDDFAGKTEKIPETPPVDEKPPETDTPGQMVVTPTDGLNVRGAPSINGPKSTVLQHGTFVQPTGATQTDASGRNWVEVKSTDVNDKPTQGWVDGQYLQSHPKGAMDESGRINPDLEKQGYREHVVQPGDTVWDIAKHDGANFRDTLELNSGHLINPGMIFPGDKVYIPGTANPPKAQPQPQPQPQPSESKGPSGGPGGSGDPSGSGGPSQSGDPSGSGSGAPSGSQPQNGGDPSGSGSGAPPAGQKPGRSGGDPSASAPDGRQRQGDGGGDPSASGGPGASAQPTTPATPAAPTPPADGQRRDSKGQTPEDVLKNYQVPFDDRPRKNWSPGPFGIGGTKELSAGEADVLDDVSVFKLGDMNDAYKKASDTPFRPGDTVKNMSQLEQNDGQQDAFRHAYWNGLMTKNVGESEANRFATAHEEGTEDNPASREAMDLYNNEQGRRIAKEHPDASDDELAGYVRDAINNGEMIVIDKNGDLAWSNQVPFGQHGHPRAGEGPGAPAQPLIDKSSS